MARISAIFYMLVAFVSVAWATPIVFTDKGSFIGATGPNLIAGFDDVAVGTSTPFSSSGVSFEGNLSPQVLDELVGLPHSFWFGAEGSSPNFLIANFQFRATFPVDVTSVGLDFQCFACDSLPNDTNMVWSLENAANATVASGSTIFDFSTGAGLPPANFLGITSDTPFRSFSIERSNGANWVADDLRYTPNLIPEPTTLLLLGSGLAGLAVFGKKKLFRKA